MAKRLSGWENDFERALTDPGRRAASTIGALMRDHNRAPSLAIHSAAYRTSETWRLVLSELGVEIPSIADHGLYLAAPEYHFSAVSLAPDQHECVLFVGHNPGLHEFALVLLRDGPQEDVARLRQGYPAGALVEFQFAIDRWSDLRPRSGRLEWLVFPCDLQSEG